MENKDLVEPNEVKEKPQESTKEGQMVQKKKVIVKEEMCHNLKVHTIEKEK